MRWGQSEEADLCDDTSAVEVVLNQQPFCLQAKSDKPAAAQSDLR